MDYEFAGLPLHVLLVHAVVIGTPVLALLLVVLAAWPAARRVLWIPALVAAIGLVPLALTTIEAGKWLESRVFPSPLVQEHTSMGETIVPWVWALLVVAVAIGAWALVERVARRRAVGAASEDESDASQPESPERRPASGRGAAIAAGVVLTVAAVVVGAGATWTIVQIGESGSRAVWEGTFSDEPLGE
ncbi:hypothetical protein FLP10_16210 [Agromyces intestinalis]|uniref:Uncharacterized protein n=1 Tax=Agromyces intestinalis TaxID=2592652 RepID=A0A5C1YIJ0_9MICO|nr:hypothetical protein [Agromyces intestinalis]QEO15791.1 hypothetical protein FLP10_16210 [Agromyces intestinalis]